MRELTLFDTGCLAGLLLFSLVLPLLMSLHQPQSEASKRLSSRIVWTGQGLLGLAGVAVLVSAPLAPYAAACGVAGCLCSTLVLLRQLRGVRPA